MGRVPSAPAVCCDIFDVVVLILVLMNIVFR